MFMDVVILKHPLSSDKVIFVGMFGVLWCSLNSLSSGIISSVYLGLCLSFFVMYFFFSTLVTLGWLFTTKNENMYETVLRGSLWTGRLRFGVLSGNQLV